MGFVLVQGKGGGSQSHAFMSIYSDFVLAAQTSITDKSLQDVSFYAYLPTTSHLDV